MTDSDLRIVFMGTPDFAVPSLRALIECGRGPVGVVTTPDRRSGRGQSVRPSPVKLEAELSGIPVLQPESLNDETFVNELKDLQPDVMVVVAFRILPEAVYSLATSGAFNLHASLLPSYRGAAPIQRALMDGVTKSGVTTFFLKPKVDTGDLILQETIDVGPDVTGGELHDRLAELGAKAVVETVRRIGARTAHSTVQDDNLASPAPKIFKDDMRIPWDRPAPVVHNHVRALSPYPAAWCLDGEDVIKIFRTRPISGGIDSGQPGEILEADDRIVVACGEGALQIIELQRSGKRRMNAVEFLHGHEFLPGDRLQ